MERLDDGNICFAQNLSSEKLAVMDDSCQWGHVVTNLAINARDAMPDGSEIRIGTRSATLDQEAAQKNGLEKSGNYLSLFIILPAGELSTSFRAGWKSK